MSTSSAKSSSDPFVSLLHRSFPVAAPSSPSDLDVNQLSHAIYPETSYTDNEKIEIAQWLTTATRLATPDEDDAKHAERLGSLNTHLSTRTTLLGSKPSVADVALYARLAPAVAKWSPEERTGEHGYHHIVRHIDFVQNAPVFGIQVAEEATVKVDVDDVRFVHKPVDAKEEKERKKKDKAEAAAAVARGGGESEKPLEVRQGKGQGGGRGKKDKAKDTTPEAKEEAKGEAKGAAPPAGEAPAGDGAVQSKREKKEKQPKAPKQAGKESPPSPSLIDLRVGHILQAINHPNADSLYVSTVACGDPAGTDNTSEHEGQVVRTVCSGLNGLIPLSEMQGRKIVAVCNLKAVTMRGVKSAAMVLAASPRVAEGGGDSHAGPVELVAPPEDATAGERVFFEGWAGEPEGVLNPKKKIWETLQPGFTTTEALEVAFDVGSVPQLLQAAGEGRKEEAVGRLVTARGGVCTVKSLRGALVR